MLCGGCFLGKRAIKFKSHLIFANQPTGHFFLMTKSHLVLEKFSVSLLLFLVHRIKN